MARNEHVPLFWHDPTTVPYLSDRGATKGSGAQSVVERLMQLPTLNCIMSCERERGVNSSERGRG